MMKKFFSLWLIFTSALVFAPFAGTKAAESKASAVENAAEQQRRYYQRQRNRRHYRGARVVTRTRIVRRGYRTYREVWQYRYLPNGRVETRLLSRTRIR